MDRRELLFGSAAALAGAFLPRLRRWPGVMIRVTYRANFGKRLGQLGADVVNVGEYRVEVIGADDPRAAVEQWKQGMARTNAEVWRSLCGPNVDVLRFVGRVS